MKSDSKKITIPKGAKIVITYGTFDLLHYGHVKLLERAKSLGDYLVVGLSTDEFNAIKHKESFLDFETRKKILQAIRYVDMVIPEQDWRQKSEDIKRYNADILVMGDDWKGEFDDLGILCKVTYLERTKDISTTLIKSSINSIQR